MFSRAFAVLLLSTIASPALAQDWRMISTSADRGAAMLIDAQTVTNAANDVHGVDILIVIKAGGAPMDAVLSETRIDCPGNKIRVGKSTSYNAAGKLLQVEEDRPEFGWDPLIEGSNYAAVADVVCGRTKMPATRFGPALPIGPVRALLAKS
ncbi:hypothetical protein OF829_17685 [Sphingomonas sp. LB-2]|uniref:surface-adhesin E family protein n=1 Tax=Sphingomonas caeni TaxID=2984949 RepID=UPI002230758F|nr:surface-adhesin E family protein [Sphingomonas caeni]MCW3849074.1 hypothetical protein [Sphingomonas caeni]